MTFASSAADRRKTESSGRSDGAVHIQRRLDLSARAVAPSIGNQQTQALLRPQPPSAFVVSEPGDPSELEAERIAGEIVHASASPSCSPGERCQCDDCVQRRATGNRTVSADVTPALNTQGRPLDEGTRAFFEPRFGRDLSDVRIHTGHDASRSARALGAHAFTVGSDIVFGEGQYAPQTESGKELVAHELVHTIQQRESSGVGIQRATPPTTKTRAYSIAEGLIQAIFALDIAVVANALAPAAISEAAAYAPGGADYGPQNALRHCIFTGLVDTWCWRMAIVELAAGLGIAVYKSLFAGALLTEAAALMGVRIGIFMQAHEVFGDDGCGNYGTGTLDSVCDRHNNDVGLSIGGPFTSDATVISESKAALDGGRLWMAPSPTMLTYHVSTGLWKTSSWMVPTPQQVDCTKVVIK